MKFLDTKTSQEIDIPEDQIVKLRWRRTTANGAERVTYGRQAELPDGRKVTRFMTKADWERLDVPEIEPAPKA